MTAQPGAARPVVARLSLNENPYGPAPGVRESIERELRDLCRYTGAELDSLIDQIAAHEDISRDQVIVGEILQPLGIYLSQQGGAGGEFIYSDPGYTALIDAAVAVGGRAIAVLLDNRLENDLAGMAARVSDRTRALYLVNPHNPTGIVADEQALRDFARNVSSRALVIVDEAYLEYTDGFAQRTLTDLVRAGENVIVFRTFAKIFGLAGVEIGYGLVPRRIATMLRAQGANDPHLFNRLAVTAAATSLRATDYVAHVRSAVAAERETWKQLLQALQLRCTPSAASFMFIETGMPHASFAAAMRAEGIEIAHAFPPYDMWARITIGLPHENKAAQAALRRVLQR
jgi:histidinol-phosphate aminotransferase